MTPEGKVKYRLKKRLKLEFPDHYLFMPVQTGMGARTLDFLICINGLFVAIETKAPGKKLSPLQELTTRAIREAGGLVYVIDGEETLDTAIAHLKSQQGVDSSAGQPTRDTISEREAFERRAARRTSWLA